MFSIDEYVVHPTGGICKISRIDALDNANVNKDIQYYYLDSVSDRGGKVFVPMDKAMGTIRYVISAETAKTLISDIPAIDELKVENEKLREECYKTAVRSSDCGELIKLIKSLHYRRLKRFAEGKKTTTTDDKYYKIALDKLISELSFAMGESKAEIKETVIARIEM